ncbi:hypothetical protein CLU81_4959 [Flavobacterium sp. 9]|uniref:hypothetical protein n=1 Tax=Flavobacterium sp. 9 TaxID=2035198 RepID=UPI000C194F58|nr:hypothetical protein [Flavobacterium sp. 9]PIF34320.1 hypothetical protein CLU81_4959 [Flavobacterium sp. 9]
MEKLDDFFELLPVNESLDVNQIAPYSTIKQSWAAYDTLSSDSSWFYGNFSSSFSEACSSRTMSRIAKSAVVFQQYQGACEGRSIHIFTHS